MMGFANNRIPNKKNAKIEQSIKPCLKADFPSAIFPEASASATRGVIAVEKPMPKDIATNIKLLPKDTAANSAEPNCPTIILSTNATKVCPNIPNITGAAKRILYPNSLVYCANKTFYLIKMILNLQIYSYSDVCFLAKIF